MGSLKNIFIKEHKVFNRSLKVIIMQNINYRPGSKGPQLPARPGKIARQCQLLLVNITVIGCSFPFCVVFQGEGRISIAFI